MKKIKKLIDIVVRFVLSLNETKRNETKTKRNETKRTTICSKIENGRRCSYLVIAPQIMERRVKA